MNYSEYFKIDLHIHTDASNLTKDNDYCGNFSFDDLYATLAKSENCIKLFSMTDHNIFNVDAYKRYYNNRDHFKDAELLIGIEFDVLKEQDLLENLNLAKSEKKLRNKKYHALIIFKSQDIDMLNEKLQIMYKIISDDFIRQFGDSLDLNAPEFVKLRKTSIDRIIQCFQNEDFLVIAHGRKDSDIINAYKDSITEAQNMILLGVINSLELSPSKTNTTLYMNEQFDMLLEEEYRGRSDIPYLVFSDNHEISAYPNHKSNQIVENRPFTWIRGAKTFESLRLAFIDPSSRIYLQFEHPKVPQKYLEEIKFNTISNNGDAQQVSLKFSPGINSIIGGRSSGKSLLVNAIMNSFEATKTSSKIAIYSRPDNRVVDASSIMSKMNFESNYKANQGSDILAFSQEAIIQLFNEDGKNLSDKLDFYHFESSVLNEYMINLKSVLNNLGDAYRSNYDNRLNKNLQLLTSDIKLSCEAKTFNVVFDSGINQLINELVEPSQQTITNIIALYNAVQSLKNLSEIKYGEKKVFDTEELELIENVMDLLTKKASLLSIVGNENKVKELFIDELTNKFPNFLKEISSEKDKVIREAKSRLDIEIGKCKIYFASKFKMKKAISELKNMEFSIDSLENKISDKYILRTKIDYQLRVEEFLEFLEDKISLFDKTNFLKNLEIMIDSGTVKIKRKSNSPDDFETLLKNFANDVSEKVKPAYVITEVGEARSVSSENMSPGKKASVYLEIILEQLNASSTSKILIIDQPEDNLDNMFITNVLIDKIRNLRGKCQVLLVTHNASIAINSDSDQIVIASNDGKSINYESGIIDDIDFRNKICKLLDGGYYVFDKRYHKYDIPKRKIYEPIFKEEVSDAI